MDTEIRVGPTEQKKGEPENTRLATVLCLADQAMCDQI